MQASSGVGLDTVGSKRVFRPVLPENVCMLDWKPGTPTDPDASYGSVERAMTDSDGDGAAECTFTLSLSTAGSQALTAKTLHVHYVDLGLKLPVPAG